MPHAQPAPEDGLPARERVRCGAGIDPREEDAIE